MLIEFSVGNFTSFKDIITFSMVKSAIKEHSTSNVFQANQDFSLLKSAVIYGANASGKSNLFKAMSFMSKFIRTSLKESLEEEINGIESFKLSTQTENKPSYFEMVFIHESTQYRYGFEVDEFEVKSEWLFYRPQKREIQLFNRDEGSFEISSEFPEGKGNEHNTRNNALFLSVLASYNGEISSKIIKWFGKLGIISGLNDNYIEYTTRQLKNSEFKQQLILFLKTADIGIDHIESKESEDSSSKFEEVLKKMISITENSEIRITKSSKVSTFHKKYNENNQMVSHAIFEMNKQESEGTRKLYSLLGPILDTLSKGRILVVDELDARLHPLITRFIIGLFHSKEHNLHNAQIIFNSHDTNLLNKLYFRRDQIWFSEKNQYGATSLYSLMEYNVRNDASYEKDYLLGKYGSIPYIGLFDFLADSIEEEENGEG